MHVVVHGGAGTSPEEPGARQRVLGRAAASGSECETPIAAVCRAVRVLESDPRFNAGVGSAVQSDGRIRTEAGLMTDGGDVGAACGLAGVEHAVDVARLVATETPHVLLAGPPAVDLASDSGIAVDIDCWTDRTRERWADADPPDGGPREQLAWVREHFGADGDGHERDRDPDVGSSSHDHDTVGAVATDGESLAAATSTGGRWFAQAGRVGDVPQVGAGFYADGRGAASATGAGEAIARFGLARRAIAELDRFGPRQAAEEAIDAFADRTGERAGAIVLDRVGHVGSAANTEAMQTARARDGPRG